MSPPDDRSTDARLSEVLAPAERGLERMRARLAQELRSEIPAVADLTQHIGRFRGKQLRGALVLLVGEATGNSTYEHPDVAAIVELIHLATLVHDDVLDGASIRRRVASVNHRWDNQVAVLLGDFLYARAFHLSTTLSSRLASRLLSVTTQEICAGEIEQAGRRYDFELSQERYEKIAGAKTATLYSAACELGARYPGGEPGGPEELSGRELARFGWELGLAFQIIDDVLDLLGDEATVGKSVGNDVEDGKVTLPVLHVYGRSDERTRAAIRDAYTAAPESGGEMRRVERLRLACDLGPGVEYARRRAEELLASARARAERLGAGPARDSLVRMVDYVPVRKW